MPPHDVTSRNIPGIIRARATTLKAALFLMIVLAFLTLAVTLPAITFIPLAPGVASGQAPAQKVIGSNALVTDVPAGVPETASYVNLEIARSGKYVSWFEGIAGSPTPTYVGYICQVNPTTGDLIPLSGKQHMVLPNARIIPTLQWGYDSTGDYCVGYDRGGSLYRIRPNGANPPAITQIADPFTAAERNRNFYPYPGKNENSPLQYVTYQRRECDRTKGG